LDKEENQSEKKNKEKPRFDFGNNRFALLFIVLLVGMIFFVMVNNSNSGSSRIAYSQFLAYLEENRIASVEITDQREINGVLKSTQESFTTIIPYLDSTLVARLEEKGVRFTGAVKPLSFFQILINLLPWIFILLFSWFMFRQVQNNGNRAFTFGRSSAKKYTDTEKKITFKDVAGSVEAKRELEDIVEYLREPESFMQIGARVPKGILLVGMPGTGKTLLARATAGEAGVSYFHISGSDFVEMFVGVGASRVRDLFSTARRSSPCVIFIDELDAVGRTRGAGYGGGHDEREQTLNQMLVEMDGFEPKEGIIILAATNRPDVLDPALLRPGRFDRHVQVDLPDMKEREEILKLHVGKLPTTDDVEVEKIARAMPGATGADLANLANEAALFATRRKSQTVSHSDFEEARDKIFMGMPRSSRLLTDEDKIKIARHEAGHALLHYFLKHADPLHKVTIIPRGQALGAAFSLPERDQYNLEEPYLLDRIKICYGGYIAEQLYYDKTSTGVKADLKQATEIARRMVIEWGMSELGPVAFAQENEPIFLGKEIATHKDYSEETAQKIDKAIRTILDYCVSEAKEILRGKKNLLDSLSELLFKSETLSDREIQEKLEIVPIRLADN